MFIFYPPKSRLTRFDVGGLDRMGGEVTCVEPMTGVLATFDRSVAVVRISLVLLFTQKYKTTPLV